MSALVLPILNYCSPVWRPSLIRDIISLERLQRRATKYILFDFQMDYKSRLETLELVPLMYYLERAELVFFVQLNHSDPCFNVYDYFSFTSSSKCTRSSKYKLVHSTLSLTQARHTFFHRLPRLWNSLPPVDLSISINKYKSL
uniref:Uncharacterized protein n=1 Tax=Amphimedon queenslandica TaxID=400682 RepID=A0A1X7TL42_AMPQE